MCGTVFEFEFLTQLVGREGVVAGEDRCSLLLEGFGQVLEHAAREWRDHLPHAPGEVGKQVVGSIEMGVRGEFAYPIVLAHETEGSGFEDSGIRLVEIAGSVLQIPITDLRLLLLSERERKRLPMVVRIVGSGES